MLSWSRAARIGAHALLATTAPMWFGAAFAQTPPVVPKQGAALLKTDLMGILAHPDDETGMAATLASYALGNTSTVTHQMQFSFVSNVLNSTWNSIGPGSSGSVVITSLTSTRIKGTFSGVLGPAPGFSSPGTATITSGVFDIGLP